MQGRFGHRSSPCRLEFDHGKEFNVKRGGIRSQSIRSDGVRAMVLGGNDSIEFSDALESMFSFLNSLSLRSLFTISFANYS